MGFFNVHKVSWCQRKSDCNVKKGRWPFSSYREIFRELDTDSYVFRELRRKDGTSYSDVRYSLLRLYHGKYHLVVFNLLGLHGDCPHIISAHPFSKGKTKLLNQTTHAPEREGQRTRKTNLARANAVIGPFTASGGIRC
jgi:hypothetical protein